MSLPPIPPRVAKLPRYEIMGMDAPVPWFVQWLSDDGRPCAPGQGKPDFRIADGSKIGRAVRERLCWVCGEKLGTYMAFVIGPMCAVNRVTSEPPNHHDCAVFSAQACPFLSRPTMRRHAKNLPEQRIDPGGIMIERNPGVTCVWITKSYSPIPVPGGALIRLGDPTDVLWFAKGLVATRKQVLASIESGYPVLLNIAEQEGLAAVKELERLRINAEALVPLDNSVLAP